jgi:hypothetical protein
MVMADYLHEGLDGVVKLFLGDADNVALVVKHAIDIMEAKQKERPESIASIRNKLHKIRQQKENLIANLMEAPGLGKVLSDKLMNLAEEENGLEDLLNRMSKEQESTGVRDLHDLVRAACRDIFALWNEAPLAKKNLLLKELIQTAQVNPQNKEVQYSLVIPCDRIFEKKHFNSVGLIERGA